MNDMRQVIIPKSDQLNADDLIAGPRTIKIADVSIRAGTEQPVSIRFDGDNGKPWKPCKSMSRVLVAMWGPDAKAYVGKSLRLYRDPDVKWGGMKVGGIRISHASDFEQADRRLINEAGELYLSLQETKGKRIPCIVRPLGAERADGSRAPERTIDDARAAIAEATTLDELRTAWLSRAMAPFRDALQTEMEDRKAALSFEPEGRTDDQHGDQHDGSVAGDLSDGGGDDRG